VKPGSLVVAYLHGGQVAHNFHHSCRNLYVHDLTHAQRLVGFIAQECGAGRITDGRNDAVEKFLRTDGEWLAFVDSDMGFEPDTFDRLIDAADPVERPIVGALAFGQRRGGLGPAGSVRLEQFPTIYRWVEGEGISGCAPMHDYPPDSLVQCDATGAACFVVHRSVLVKLAQTFPAPRHWFDETIHRGRVFGEDLTFFKRCTDLGYPVFVHTGVKTSHFKHIYLTDETQQLIDDIPTFVVIPMKDRMDLTGPLLEQLAEQDEYQRILLYDNGSMEETKSELAELDVPRLTVTDAAGWNIHQMWNAGLAEAKRLAWPCNIAILNNDLKIGPAFLSGLARELRRDPLLAAVSPNYDSRAGDGVQYVTEICADRYDGTGGLAGFAFMLKSDGNYSFPDELHWWYGDNHMLASIAYAGSKAGIVLGTTVEHVGGGKQTGGWDDPERAAEIEQDRQWFHSWLRSMSPAPEQHVIVLWSGCDAVDKIREDVRTRFTVVDQWRQEWPGFVGELSRFYDTDATAKAEQCGTGAFTVLVVRDDTPAYGERETTRGTRQVNTNLFDAKQLWRSWTSNVETVHASDTVDDALGNLAVLRPGFDDLESALAAITCDYVVLRNFDGEPTGDVDLLVRSLPEAVRDLGALRLHPEPHRVQYAVRIGGQWTPFDLRHIDDGYYDADWQCDILDSRQGNRPDDEHWYYSLLYHALHHKGTLAGYADTLERIRPGAEHTREALAKWMAKWGYRYTHPTDVTVPLFGVLVGTVATGHGAAARDVKAGWYDETLGYEPYPGTLNLTVTGPVGMPPGQHQVTTPDGRTLLLWPARANGVDCWLMAGGDSSNTVELLAALCLREWLGVDDGDQVTVEVGHGGD
jgi:hypothetical protein